MSDSRRYDSNRDNYSRGNDRDDSRGHGGRKIPGDDKDDWKCECGGMNYANRQQCYKCKADKPRRSSESHSSHHRDSDRHDDRHHHSDHHRDSDSRSDHHSEHRSSRDDSYHSHSDYRDNNNVNNNSYRSSNSSSTPYSSSSSSAPAEVHQCDGHCDSSCPNNRIYISGLNPSTTEDDIVDFFKQIGIIAQRKIKGKFKDQWPYQVYLYKNKDGSNKGDAAVTYEEAASAHQAVNFFNGNEFKGNKIEVSMATMKAAPPSSGYEKKNDYKNYNNRNNYRRDNRPRPY